MENKRKISSYNHGVVWYPRTNVLCTFVQVVNVLLLLGLLGGAAPWSVKGSPHCSNQTNSGAIRPHSVAIAEFGAVGDGATLNIKAIHNPIGDNSTSGDQGSIWWDWFRNKTLNYTRPHLLELINSTGVVISNLTFLSSPFWTLHLHIADSSDNLCIEDCHISTGDELVFIKSGWDEYGTLYGRPSRNIILLRITSKTETSAGIAIGSEMSGVVSEVHAEDLHFFGSKTGIAIRFTSQYEERPDEFYDPNFSEVHFDESKSTLNGE
ncbi:hypothetical protein ACFX13_026429 [Malus domestica]